MFLKRRVLQSGQRVKKLYDSKIGFVQEDLEFKHYKKIEIGEVEHDIPIFKDQNGHEVSGLTCFWALPEEVHNIPNTEKALIALQIAASQISKNLGYNVPMKINDSKIEQIANEKNSIRQSLVQKLGYDPFDESWIETEMHANDREHNWFVFEREHGLVFAHKWDDLIHLFNAKYNDNIAVDEAKQLAKKRMRYILGSYNTRLSNPNRQDWKTSARQFEEFHRSRELRMLEWSNKHRDKWPMTRVKRPVKFWPGPYFNECIEKVPYVFTSPRCDQIRDGVLLCVTSYDVQHRYIQLDFTGEVKELIKRDKKAEDDLDYQIWVRPDEIDEHLEIIDKLD